MKSFANNMILIESFANKEKNWKKSKSKKIMKCPEYQMFSRFDNIMRLYELRFNFK